MYDELGRFEGGLAVTSRSRPGRSACRRILNLPRARFEAPARAVASMGLFLAPDGSTRRVRWSPVLFHIRQVIVSPADATAIATPRALFGRRFGTLLNYTYPELQPYFADGRIQRSDGPSFDSNIAKLGRGRIEAFLNDDIAALYAARSGRLPADVRIDPLWAPENPVHCAFAPAFAARAPRWREILQAQVSGGAVDRAIATYTGGRRTRAPAANP